MDAAGLTFLDDLGAGGLDDGEEFFLLFVGDLELVKCGFEVAEGRIELRVGDVHAGVGRSHLFPLVRLQLCDLQNKRLLLIGQPGSRRDRNDKKLYIYD